MSALGQDVTPGPIRDDRNDAALPDREFPPYAYATEVQRCRHVSQLPARSCRRELSEPPETTQADARCVGSPWELVPVTVGPERWADVRALLAARRGTNEATVVLTRR